MSKGSWQRGMTATEKAHFNSEYDRIFGPKKLNNMEDGDANPRSNLPCTYWQNLRDMPDEYPPAFAAEECGCYRCKDAPPPDPTKDTKDVVPFPLDKILDDN